MSESACPRIALLTAEAVPPRFFHFEKEWKVLGKPEKKIRVKERLSESACPRIALLTAEAVPPKFFHFEKQWKVLGKSEKKIRVKKR